MDLGGWWASVRSWMTECPSEWRQFAVSTLSTKLLSVNHPKGR
ncbi:hypothetical protein [Fervidibacter sp.]